MLPNLQLSADLVIFTVEIFKEKLYFLCSGSSKISALSSGKTDKYEYLTEEQMLSSNQRQRIDQGKFVYFPAGKAFEKQTKTIEDQGKKQVKSLKA